MELKSGAADAFDPHVVIVTGAAGFIGSNLVRRLLDSHPSVSVIALDLLTYAGNVANLAEVAAQHGPDGDGRFFFIAGDINDAALMAALLEGRAREDSTGRASPRPDALLHLAAESHVDRSIAGPQAFVRTNVQGTLTLLEATRRELAERPRPFRFVNVSTDEVYGSLGADDPPFSETHPLMPNSPYSASKAGGDCLVRAYQETHGLPCLTTRCSNNFGPFQYPEKLIPLMITRALSDQPLPVYGDGLNVRDWLYVDDHCDAIVSVLLRGRVGEIYNIGGNAEQRNLDVVHGLLQLLGKPRSLVRFVTDRPGHDRRYAMNSRKIASELGWAPAYRFDSALEATVTWYLDHGRWWRDIREEKHLGRRNPYEAG